MPNPIILSQPKRILLSRYLQGSARVLPKDQPRLVRRASRTAVPLSFSQQQVWVHSRMAPENIPVYNETLTIRRTGELDVGLLEKTLAEIIRRHEIWRTTFAVINDQPVQVIHAAPAGGYTLAVRDLHTLSEVEREKEAIRFASQEARRPFDLEKRPLMRATLVKLGDNDSRLYMTFHQLVFDGVTAYQVFLPELTAIYEAFSQNRPSPLPEPDAQYADYALWQRESLKEGMLARQMAYWQDKLAGELPTLRWPTGRRRPAIQTYRGEVQTGFISGDLVQKLTALSQKQRATLFMVLVAGFSALMFRYTGQEDIILGAPTAGRRAPETQRMLGYFLNLLPLRIDLSGNPSFQVLLSRVRQTVLEALSNSEMPFTQLVEKLRATTDPSRNPLFQIAISLEPRILGADTGWTATQSDVPTGASKLDLYIDLDERPEGIIGPVTYNPDMFEGDTIIRTLEHWRNLLEGAVADPAKPISELPILTAKEQNQLLVEWNDTSRLYPHACIHNLFEAQAKQSPDDTAVVFENSQLSYGKLNERANQLAWYLRKLGVSSEVPVGLCVERSLEMVIGLLAILKAGGTYIPLDPSFPVDRLAFMVCDAKPRVLLTQQLLCSRLPQTEKLVLLDRDWPLIERQSQMNLGERTCPWNLAYVIYTSGSTGKPKGVTVEHRSVVNLLCSMQRELGLSRKDALLAVTTLSFDIAGLEIYLPLISGARLVVASSEDAADGASLSDLLLRCKASMMQATPTTWRLLIDAGWKGSPELKVLSGGEPLPPELGRELTKRSLSVWNVYGPTETTVWSSLYRLTGLEEEATPIGRPIANTRVYVLDAYKNLMPVGIPGEIYIGGDGVARGYLNRQEMTAEKFVSDPFNGVPQSRLYRTGDLGRYRADGNIECLGRLDHQVKIRGFRIEPGEIESVLGEQEGVRHSVVVAREQAPGGNRLVAYFEPRNGCAPSASDLRAHLKRKLPSYMLPSAFVAMEKLPLTPSGKIDRNALPALDNGRPKMASDFVAPRDLVEQLIARLWSKVLSVKCVGLHDNFFELGGHSLLAIRIMAQIEKLFKKRMPPTTLLQAPTIAELASMVRNEDWQPPWSSLVPLRPGGSKPPLFLMHAHGGDVLEYYPLANCLKDQPVFAFQAGGLAGHMVKGQSLEEMAAAYVAELRMLQPEGPYFVGGFCYGGLLALEAAHQLSAAGEEVALTVLIQTMNPAYARFSPDVGVFRGWWYRAATRIDLERENLSYRGPGYIRERCRHAINMVRARAAIAFDPAITNGNQRHFGLSMPYILESLSLEHEKALKRYVPKPFDGKVLLFRATKQLPGLMIDQFLGWKDLLRGSLDVYEVPGHQQNMLLQPNVAYLGRQLTTQLRAVQERRGL